MKKLNYTVKKRDEEIDRARRKLEEARRIKAAHTNMITTTCSNIEGRRIKEYKGIISGASVYFFITEESDKRQNEIFPEAKTKRHSKTCRKSDH